MIDIKKVNLESCTYQNDLLHALIIMQLKFCFNLLSTETAMDSDGSGTKRRQFYPPKERAQSLVLA